MLRLFLTGSLAAAFALIGELLVFSVCTIRNYDPTETAWLFSLPAILVSAGLEELFKDLTILKASYPRSRPAAIVHQAFVIGSGFALTEGAIIFWKNSTLFGIPGVMLVHLTTAILAGIILAIIRRGILAVPLALALSVSIHFSYNYLILTGKL